MADTDEVRIGDFSKPVVSRKPEEKGPASPTRDALVSAESRLDEEATRDEASLKPMERYAKALQEEGIDKAKAAEIVDSVLLKGAWAEDVKITSRITIRLRTRNARDTKRIHEILEAQRFTIDAHYHEAWLRFQLAASLEKLGNDSFTHPDPRKAAPDVVEKAFQDRVAYVDALPDPVLRIAMNKLLKFDRKITVVLEEGAIENF
jgi:hypothetical protein